MRDPKNPDRFIKRFGTVERALISSHSWSGLGLEGQRDAIAAFAKAEGFAITKIFEEHETGKGADALNRRPQLAAAIKAAQSAALRKRPPWPSACGRSWPSLPACRRIRQRPS